MCLHESPGKSFLQIVLLFPGNLYYWPGIIFPRKSGTFLPRRELRRQCPRGFTWQYFRFNMWLTSKNCAFKNTLVYPTLWEFRKFESPEGNCESSARRGPLDSVSTLICGCRVKIRFSKILYCIPLFESLKTIYPPKAVCESGPQGST